MASEYKRNHTIPRCMLDYWVDNTGTFPCVHVYDIRQDRIYKSESRGKKAFSFAIENDLHIVEVNNHRATSVEQLLASLEGTLCHFLRAVHKRSPFELESSEEIKLAMAFQALECRSRYDLQLVRSYISRNQKPGLSDEKKLTLENFIDYLTTMARGFVPLEIVAINSGDDSWIISDRPFFHSAEISHRLLVLTNKVLIGYKKSANNSRYTYLDCPSTVEMNRMIAFQARDWIAADNAQTLQKYISVFKEPAWKESKEKDGVTELILPIPTQGWVINK
jgi:hypothetical protein